MKVFSLPNDVMVCVLNCCSLKDLQKLDSACSSSTDRQILSDCYQWIKCSFVDYIDSFWICFRKFGIACLCIGKTNAAGFESTFFRKLFNRLTELTYLYVCDIDIFNLDILTTLDINSLKKLKVLHVYNVSGDFFNDQFLISLMAFCPCLETIALDTPQYASFTATTIARVFHDHQSLSSFSSRYSVKGPSYEICVYRNGKVIRLDCEAIDEQNLYDFFGAFERNSFEEIELSNFYAAKVDEEVLFDLITRQCPQLRCLDIDYVDEHTATALRSLLHNTPSLHELSFRHSIFKEYIGDYGGFEPLFSEKLPGNVTKLKFNLLWNTFTTETVKHILALNDNITYIELNECAFVEVSAVQTFVDELVARGRNLTLKARQTMDWSSVHMLLQLQQQLVQQLEQQQQEQGQQQ